MKKIVLPKRNFTLAILLFALSVVLLVVTYKLLNLPNPFENSVNIALLLVSFVVGVVSIKTAITSIQEQIMIAKDFYPIEMKRSSTIILKLANTLERRLEGRSYEVETNEKGIRLLENLTQGEISALGKGESVELDCCILRKQGMGNHYQLLYFKYQVSRNGDNYQLVPIYKNGQKIPFKQVSVSSKLQDLDRLLFTSRHRDYWDADYDALSTWMSEVSASFIATALILLIDWVRQSN